MECCLVLHDFPTSFWNVTNGMIKIFSGKCQQGQILVSQGEFFILFSVSCLKYSVIMCFQAKCRTWWTAKATVTSSVLRLSTYNWQGLSVLTPWWHFMCTQRHQTRSLCLKICHSFPSCQSISSRRPFTVSPAPFPTKCPIPVSTKVSTPMGQLSSGRGMRGKGSVWSVSMKATPSWGTTCPRNTWRNGSAKWRPSVLPSNTSGTCSLCCALTLWWQEKVSQSQTKHQSH